MKKIILSLFLSIIWFVGFSSAENIVINANNLPTSLMLDQSINNYDFVFDWVSNVYWNSCAVSVKSVEWYDVCQYNINSDNSTSTTCDTYSPESAYYPSVNGPFKFVWFGWWCLSYNPDWSLVLSLPWQWWNTWWWNEWWNWWNIVPDWSIFAVISGVFSVFTELIPYIVYLWIWILIFTVWFYAIRWLVNWVSNKINNNFKF